jgi:2-C-methyl-D-erythritol 4-phosphate cytidylyltransferase
VQLAGRPMVEWSIAAFRACASVRSIVIAAPPGRVHELGGEDLRVVEGGAARALSVANALTAVATELVAVHDAARPLVTPQLVEDVIATLIADRHADGAIAAAPLVDTVKRTTGDAPNETTRAPFPTSEVGKGGHVVASTLDRGRLWAAQTPQVFRAEALRRALEAYPADAPPATDEALLVEAAGGRVLIHPSSPENLKVTTPFDLQVAGLLLANRSAR